MSEPNPFSAPRGLPQQQPQASPQAPPQVKTLGMLVSEWQAAPGAALGAAHPAAACTPSPPPLRLVAFCSSAPPPPLPPPAAAAAAAAEPPPLCDALLLARQQQWQRLVGCGPAAQQLLPAGAALTPGALALARCRLGALAATRRWLCAVEESSHVLQALARHCSSGSGDSGDAAAASAVWLCLHAEALRACSLWREAFYVAHGVVRALQLPAPAGSSGVGGSSSWVAPLDAGPAAGAAAAGGAAAAAPEAAAVAATAAAVEGALAALASGSAAIAPRAAARLVILAGSVCAAALTGPAFYLGAANAASDAAAAVASRLRSPPAPAPAPPPSPPLLLQLAAEDGGLHWALEAPPEWVSQGLALLGCVRTHRTIGREEEAKAALGALFALPQWRAAGDLLIAVTQGGSVGSAELAALSPPTAYALGVLGCIRGGEALALARPGEALPLYEAAIVALASRFLPVAGGGGGGGGGGGPAAAAAASASLLGASSCLASSAGGQTLLPVRPGGGGSSGASGSAPSAAAPGAGAGGGGAPQGFLADPCDLLVDAAIGAAEAVRRLPPPALSSTSVQQPPPPIVLSMTLLEALVRSCPAVCLRAALASALTGLYDAGRDAMAAAAGKRLLAALAHAYGLGHLDRADFRIVA